ncbi:hypothetical protein L227DRAFT_611163 [Lentinus tigrinus ALCF2SS1-6]|uniref:Fungal-type protein kinase domain-containing protein n=1 Tax=Lentinus tigrinus ALCF2SS1-6 TaxID=1328759 RepID=A0A5C2S9X8_9APHY|nr:hypothetical protein L227DRAFT_611163 [Lentinus tigrinus ALCF2SS1-6]
MGRGTRGFVGWDLDADRVVFDGDESRSAELDTHIPTVLGGGDVKSDPSRSDDPQCTAAQKLNDVASAPGVVVRIHYRIVIKQIGRRLKDFEHTVELVIGVYDALLGHQRAWVKCKILHRDVSINNILLLGTGADCRGLLCDWDLAQTEEQLNDYETTQGLRLGTWQTMSALLQQYASKRHQLSDDLESFLHILTYSALRYFAPTGDGVNVQGIARKMHEHFNVTTTRGLSEVPDGVPWA